MQEPACGCHTQPSPPAPAVQGAGRHPCPRIPEKNTTNNSSVKAKSRGQMRCCFFVCPLVNVPPFQPLPQGGERGERQPWGSAPAPGCWVGHSGQPHGWGDGTSRPCHILTLPHLPSGLSGGHQQVHDMGMGRAAGNRHRK